MRVFRKLTIDFIIRVYLCIRGKKQLRFLLKTTELSR